MEMAHSDEPLMIEISSNTADAGEMLLVDVTFTTMSGESVSHINYNIVATQNGEVVLEENDVHDHDGVVEHMTAPLPAATSDDTPVEVKVTFNGYGMPGEEMTGPIGEVATKQVVPEFGTIAMMVLAVAIISIVAVTAKSRVVPRFQEFLFFYFLFTKAIIAKIIAAAAIDNPKIAKSYAAPPSEVVVVSPDFNLEISC